MLPTAGASRSSSLGQRETSLGRLPLPTHWKLLDSWQLKGSLLQGSCPVRPPYFQGTIVSAGPDSS